MIPDDIDPSESDHHPETHIIHEGRDPQSNYGFVNPPVVRGSTVLFPTLSALKSADQPFTYGRRGTPTTQALEDAIRVLEGGEVTVLVSSGLQAVFVSIMALVETGDHILVSDSVYQPTRTFCDKVLSKLGVTTTYYDPTVGIGIRSLVTPKTRLIFAESPGSQTFEMQDIPAISDVAHSRKIWHVMDNTWATPLYFKALDYGVDLSIHAATKYIVGHADAMLGVVTANARAAPYLKRMQAALGVCPGSEETFLGLRGLRTLSVRLARHQQSAVEIASWLQSRPEVARVLHPALPNDPGHEIWKRDFCGASGLFSIVLVPAPESALAAFVDHLELFGMGYSWGGYESLALPFNPRTYRTATTWDEPGHAIRFHIGLEDPTDLRADLEAGFARFNAVRNV